MSTSAGGDPPSGDPVPRGTVESGPAGSRTGTAWPEEGQGMAADRAGAIQQEAVRLSVRRRGPSETARIAVADGPGRSGARLVREGHPMTSVITDACVHDQHHRVPRRLRRRGTRALYVHPGECLDGGTCEPGCSVTAIAPDHQRVPDAQRSALVRAGETFTRGLLDGAAL